VHPAPPSPRANGEARPVVLVVEDNDQAADLLVRQLDHGGFHGVVAASGTEALAKARELQPVAITLDIVLPGLDGWDVLTQLKHDDATRDIPVVVVSVVDKPEFGKALGALDYFVKPINGKALLARLAKYTFANKLATDKTRVLTIDDEPANLRWLNGVLEPAGFSVTSAGGGRDGIDLAKASLPDLILLDLMMPDVNGFDVVEALYADQSTRSIPIMILTAKDLTDRDKRQLNGHAKAILERGSTGATDILAWLDRLMTVRPETSKQR
jgi:CheY-like chemotaxis protein